MALVGRTVTGSYEPGNGSNVVLVSLAPVVARATDRAIDGLLKGPILLNTL